MGRLLFSSSRVEAGWFGFGSKDGLFARFCLVSLLVKSSSAAGTMYLLLLALLAHSIIRLTSNPCPRYQVPVLG